MPRGDSRRRCMALCHQHIREPSMQVGPRNACAAPRAFQCPAASRAAQPKARSDRKSASRILRSRMCAEPSGSAHRRRPSRARPSEKLPYIQPQVAQSSLPRSASSCGILSPKTIRLSQLAHYPGLPLGCRLRRNRSGCGRWFSVCSRIAARSLKHGKRLKRHGGVYGRNEYAAPDRISALLAARRGFYTGCTV